MVGGVVSTPDGTRYPALSVVLYCVAAENPVSKEVNKRFTVSNLAPPQCDVVDSAGIMIFPGVAGFSALPAEIAGLNYKAVGPRLEAFGFDAALASGHAEAPGC